MKNDCFVSVKEFHAKTTIVKSDVVEEDFVEIDVLEDSVVSILTGIKQNFIIEKARSIKKYYNFLSILFYKYCTDLFVEYNIIKPFTMQRKKIHTIIK